MIDQTPKCEICKRPMKNLGNVSGIVLASFPAQWDEVYVCETDKTKQTMRVHGTFPEIPDLTGFKEQV